MALLLSRDQFEMPYTRSLQRTATGGSVRKKPAGSPRPKNGPGFYNFIAILFFLPCAVSSQSLGPTSLRHTHFYEGVPITEFKSPSVKIELKTGKYSPDPPAIFEGVPYCATDSGKVVSINLLSDNNANDHQIEDIRISHSYYSGGTIFGPPLVTNRLVVFGSSANYLAAFDRVSAKLLWKFRTKAPIKSSPAYTNGLIYFGCDDGYLYTLDTLGKIKWKVDLKGPVASPAYDNGVIYVGTQKSLIVALDALTGKELWRTNSGGRAPCLGDSILYILNQNGVIVALDKQSGVERWRYDDGENIMSSAFELALAPSSLIYTADKKVIALDPASGLIQWSKELSQQICGTSMIVTDIVYVPCSDFHLYGLDLSRGLTLTQADIGFAPYGSPAYSDGKIFYPSKKVLHILSPVQ